MLDYLLLVSFSLLLAGVFSAYVTVSVMKGDDVTLNPDVINEMVRWKFKDINITTNDQSRDRLILENQTGSLTIQNIRTEDTGEYKLEIKTSTDKILKPFKTFNITLNDKVESVSVMKEESVTLNTKTPTQADDVIKWMFKNTLIAKVERGINPQPDPVLDEKFRGRLDVDSRGYLIITQIKINESGLYDVNITSSNRFIRKRFSVTVTGADKVESVSGVEGETVTLNTDTQPQADDVIEWKFKNTLIAKVDKRIPSDYFSNERFRDRLDVNSRGSLIIKKLRTEDFGLYDVNIKSSKHIIHKRFNLTVSGQNLWIIVPSVLGALIVIGIGIILFKKYKGKKCTFKSNNGKETHSPVLLSQTQDVTQDTETSPREISKNEEEE